MGLAEIVLKDLVSTTEGTEITAATIMAVIAEYFSVSMDDLTGASRSRVLVQARQIAMYLCRELTELWLRRSVRRSAVETTPQSCMPIGRSDP